ncbi:MAG: hypothetical protein O7G85_12605 [Planctomycetota bacterium]|nr:hypothetical protein [Planctomycetota bacterium]
MIDPIASESESTLLCIACGYDLRDLPEAGDCPECGLAIERSKRSDQLSRAHPDWLKRVLRGLFILKIGLIGIVVVLTMPIPAVVLTMISVPIGAWFGPFMIGLIAIFFVSIILCSVGAYWLCLPDPGIGADHDQARVRTLSRVGMIGLPVSILGLFVLELASGVLIVGTGVGTALFLWFASLVIIASILRVSGVLKRVPSPRLSKKIDRSAKRLLWCVPLFIVMQAFSSLITPTLPMAPAPILTSPSVIAAMAISCTTLILGLVIYVCLLKVVLQMWSSRRVIMNCLAVALELNEVTAQKKRQDAGTS